MNENALELGRKFLATYLKGKKVDYETYHPWRNNWEFVLLHSFRVESYAKKILAMEKHGLSPNETLIIRLAAILHDIGRIITRENHAKLSKDIISEWLATEDSIKLTKEETSKLLYLIGKHSDKEDGDEDYSLKVVRDADILDEIGAISIFMASNWIDRGNPYFFELLQDRIEKREITFCNEGFKLIKTESAKIILQEKKDFITLFNNQLKDELIGTEVFGKTSIEDYYKV